MMFGMPSGSAIGSTAVVALVMGMNTASAQADSSDDLFERTMDRLLLMQRPGGWLVSAAEMPGFLEVAVEHGMADLWRGDPFDGESDVRYTLGFRPKEARTLVFGGDRVELPAVMFDNLRTARGGRSEEGPYDRLVLMVHEPHWSLQEQYQLLAGLRELMAANSSTDFWFLVEGNFEGFDREIRTSPLDGWLPQGPDRNAVLLRLLQQYIVDGPLAYRLMSQLDIPALAIDSPSHIAQTPPSAGLLMLIQAVTRLKESLEAAPDQLGGLAFTIEISAELIRSESQNLDDYDRADEALDKLEESIEQFGQGLEIIDENDLKLLRSDLTSTRMALERDRVMAETINRFLKDHDEIPIIFAGSFHTTGIVRRLPKGTAVVVLEPRHFRQNETEFNTFNEAIHGRSEYLDQWASHWVSEEASQLKLPVAPQESSHTIIHNGIRAEIERIAAWEEDLRDRSLLSLDATDRLIDAIKRCGTLVGADIVFGAERPRNVPGLGTAFASFTSATSEQPARLEIYESRLRSWDSEHRIDLMLKSLVTPPLARNGRRARIEHYDLSTADRVRDPAQDPLHDAIMQNTRSKTDETDTPSEEQTEPVVLRKRIYPDRRYFFIIYDAPSGASYLYDGVEPDQCYNLLNPRMEADVNPFMRIGTLD